MTIVTVTLNAALDVTYDVQALAVASRRDGGATLLNEPGPEAHAAERQVDRQVADPAAAELLGEALGAEAVGHTQRGSAGTDAGARAAEGPGGTAS